MDIKRLLLLKTALLVILFFSLAFELYLLYALGHLAFDKFGSEGIACVYGGFACHWGLSFYYSEFLPNLKMTIEQMKAVRFSEV